MLKKLPFYPILFSIFPVLSLTAYNLGEISLDAALRPLLVSLLFGALLFGLAKWLLRDWYRAALAVLTILFVFFSYGQIYNLLEDVTFGNVSIFRHRTLLPLFAILVAVILYFIARRPRGSTAFTLGFNLLSMFLLIYPSSKILVSALQQESGDHPTPVSYSQVAANTVRPDIYYHHFGCLWSGRCFAKPARV